MVKKHMNTHKNRNVRNNNPLNIRATQTRWQGMTGDDGEFVQFDSPEMGFRAAYRTLMTYRQRHGLTTIEGIINRWAPSNENHTDNYVAYIREKMNIASSLHNAYNDTVPLDRYPELMLHMANMEGAQGAFSLEQAELGTALA
jgi:hypothetical protein